MSSAWIILRFPTLPNDNRQCEESNWWSASVKQQRKSVFVIVIHQIRSVDLLHGSQEDRRHGFYIGSQEETRQKETRMMISKKILITSHHCRSRKHIWDQKTGLAKLSKSYEESYRFQIFKHSKRRSRVRGDKIWCEKSKSPEILHRYNAAVFYSAPSYRNARAPDSLHRRVHRVFPVKKNDANF